jgi:hypothetical protein
VNIKHKTTSSRFIACLAASWLSACGGNSLSESDSIKATAAALRGSQMAEDQVFSGLQVQGGPSSPVTVNASGGQFTASGPLSNPQGGSISISAMGTYSMDGSVNYTATLTYNNWNDAATNLILNGTLNDKVSGGGNLKSLMVQDNYTGELQVSGALSGSVDFDLAAKVTTAGTSACLTESGQVGGYPINITEGC